MLRSRSWKTYALGVVSLLIVTAVLVTTRFIAQTIAAPQPVIVELKSDPVIVAKTLAEAQRPEL